MKHRSWPPLTKKSKITDEELERMYEEDFYKINVKILILTHKLENSKRNLKQAKENKKTLLNKLRQNYERTII